MFQLLFDYFFLYLWSRVQLEQTSLAFSFNSGSVGPIFHVLKLPWNKTSDFIVTWVYRSADISNWCWHCSFVNLFKSASFFKYVILRNCFVDESMLSYSKMFHTSIHKWFFLFYLFLNYFIPISTHIYHGRHAALIWSVKSCDDLFANFQI